MKTKIAKINTKICSDEAVEFQVQVHGVVNRARVEYGDGSTEDITLPPDTLNPTLFCEHRFKTGRHRILFVVYNQANRLLDRQIVSWGQN